MAQRVMDCGDAGHILVSKRVADDLAPYPKWNRHLHDLGECEVKHGRRIAVFNFHTDALGNPQLPAKFRLKRLSARAAKRRLYLTAGGTLLALAICATLFWPRSSAALSIAVLPFRDGSPAHDQEYFSEGLTEQVMRSLGRLPGLFVMGRSSSFAFKGNDDDARKIGKALGVTHVLEGSVTRQPGRVRLSAELIAVRTGFQVWRDDYDVSERDALSLQIEIAKQIARALQIRLQGADATHISKPPTTDPEANDLYLQGRALLNNRNVPSLQSARELLTRAAARDPGFAAAYAALADTYILLAEYGAISNSDAAKLAWPNVAKALELDPNLSDGHASRAMLFAHFDWDWPAADGEYQRALKLNPNSVPARHWYALHLAELGKFEPALTQIAAAQARDPLAPIIRAACGKILCVARRYDEAVEQCRLALELQPNFQPALAVMSQAYVGQGKFREAIELTRRADELDGTDASLGLAYMYGVGGERDEAERIVARVVAAQEFSSYELATVHSALGNDAEALHWLNVAIDRRSLAVVWCRVDPRLDRIRATPQFAEALARLRPKAATD